MYDCYIQFSSTLSICSWSLPKFAVARLRLGRPLSRRPIAVHAVGARVAASAAGAVALRSARLRSGATHAHPTGRRLEATG